MHSLFAGIQVTPILVTLGFGAAAFQNWFRFYSIETILVLLGAGMVSFWLAASNPQAPQYFGLIERINVYGYLLWVLVLAIVLLRVEKDTLTQS
jgi:hypothetical protein